jgi:hypothetical protein
MSYIVLNPLVWLLTGTVAAQNLSSPVRRQEIAQLLVSVVPSRLLRSSTNVTENTDMVIVGNNNTIATQRILPLL